MTPEEFAKRLTPEALADLKRELLQKIVLVVEGNVKARTPVKTGTLRRSITSRVETAQERGIVGTNVVYAPYVNRKRRFMEQGLEDSQGQIERILLDSGGAFLEAVSS